MGLCLSEVCLTGNEERSLLVTLSGYLPHCCKTAINCVSHVGRLDVSFFIVKYLTLQLAGDLTYMYIYIYQRLLKMHYYDIIFSYTESNLDQANCIVYLTPTILMFLFDVYTVSICKELNLRRICCVLLCTYENPPNAPIGNSRRMIVWVIKAASPCNARVLLVIYNIKHKLT